MSIDADSKDHERELEADNEQIIRLLKMNNALLEYIANLPPGTAKTLIED